MLNAIFRSIFGTKHERDVKRMRPVVDAINALEPGLQALSDAALRAKTDELRKRLADGGRARRPAARGLRACAARRRGARCACATSTCSSWAAWCCTRARSPRWRPARARPWWPRCPPTSTPCPASGVHVVTVNDYLARRDAQWMGPIYHALGLSVGVIQHEMSVPLRPGATSRSDIRLTALRPVHAAGGLPRPTSPTAPTTSSASTTSATTCSFSLDDIVQREHHYAIVDEVDSILIDEARTPLIISGPAERVDRARYYKRSTGSSPSSSGRPPSSRASSRRSRSQAEGDFIVDEKARTVSLTEQGDRATASGCSASRTSTTPPTSRSLHHIHQALKAHAPLPQGRGLRGQGRRRSSSSTSSPAA